MKETLSHYQSLANQHLTNFLETNPVQPEKLNLALKYATLDQGKRIRPAIVFAMGEALKQDTSSLLDLAGAVELIHCYSLVHDDLPAMDDDDLRRGIPTCHIKFDEYTAILTGDAQQTLAFQMISQSQSLTAEQKVSAIEILSLASGPNGMVSGQMIDMASAGILAELSELKQMHALKTGKLIEAAFLLGAVTAPNFNEIRKTVSEMALAVGLAFQIQDDILDIESTTEILGKPQGSDQALNKSTYPSLLGLQASKQLRDETIQSAKDSLQTLPFKSLFIEQLIDYIANRSH